LKPIDLFTWRCHAYPDGWCAIDEYGRFHVNHPFDWPRELALHALGGTTTDCTCLNTLRRYQGMGEESAALRCRRRLPPLPDHPWPKEDRPLGRLFLTQLANRVVGVLRKRGWDAELAPPSVESTHGDWRAELTPSPVTPTYGNEKSYIFARIGSGRVGASLQGVDGTTSVYTREHVGWGLDTVAPDHSQIVNVVVAFYELQFFKGIARWASRRAFDHEHARRQDLLLHYRDLLQLRSPDSTPPRIIYAAQDCSSKEGSFLGEYGSPDEYRRRLALAFSDFSCRASNVS
jgi:hypothetical protein